MGTRFRLVAAALVVMIGATACGAGSNTTREPSNPSVVASSANKLRQAIRSKRGRPVVVNYWATWCDPCKTEMPRLVAAAGRYKRTIAFVGVNVEDDLTAARSFAARYRMPFRSHAMSRSEVQRSQDILGLPVTQFYRADGELAFVHQGEISVADLQEKISELLSVGRPVSQPRG